MQCTTQQTRKPDDERAGLLMARMRDAAARRRIPVAGAFDLTYRCNLRCVHCYAGHWCGQTRAAARELPTATVLDLLAAAAGAGCVSLLLSGGEPLLRDDFVAVYAGARSLGMVVDLFTNATLVRDEHVEVLTAYPASRVEVSIYGATAGTYERVTRVPGSYARALRGIERLQEAGVRVGLKTMILRDNEAEVPAMEQLADRLGVRFRLDALVTPRLDGGREPLAQRVTAERAAELEAMSEKRVQDTLAHVDRERAAASVDRVYRCSAGLMSFHLDPWGVLRPCLTSREPAVSVLERGFVPAWSSVSRQLDALKTADDDLCAGCPSIAFCGYCPALFALETGSVRKPAEYVCALGESRARALEIHV